MKRKRDHFSHSPANQGIKFTDFGNYFACIRHDLFTNVMESHNKVLISDSIIIDHKRNQKINLSKLMSFEETIIRVINGGELSLLYDLIEEYFNLNDNEVWKRWSVYVEELLDFLDNMTFSKQQEQAREDLKFAYYVEYQRLTQRIGTKEFASIIGWTPQQLAACYSKLNNKLPIPVEFTAATPLWTIGQAENFSRMISATKKSKHRSERRSIEN